jgi:rubrerythrin
MGLYDDKNPCKRAVILGKAIKALEQEPRGEMLICPECGLDVHSDFKTCPRCGARMAESEG